MRSVTKQEANWKYLNPFGPFWGFWRYRDLLAQLVRRNIEARYKGTMMGLVWVVVTPLLMLAVYTFVFGCVFKARWSGDLGDSKAAFALIMFCGMSVFNIFSESINGSVSVIPGNTNYVKKVVFPLEILPAAAVLTAIFFGLIWFGLLFLGVGIFLHRFSAAILFLPFLIGALFLLSCGTAWIAASLGVYFRDLPHAVGILLQVLTFMTPIFYSIEMVPEFFRPALLINPLTPMVEYARKVVIFDQWPNGYSFGILALFSFGVFQLGYFWFMKTKRGFADVL
ncbi:MAG TPA: ABC transporter permease [Candidatus Omnitrophota bacterium]|nr:ABC transporter permease [Candidatus Omnitrophota bacterium]HPS36809.1 ABC transporter permease [Candidatus Omnitrophota bacterium]